MNRIVHVAAILIVWATAPGAQEPPPPTFRTDVYLLSLAVRVTDRKNVEIRGLTADRFSLYEDGIRQQIAFFAAEEEPLSLGMLLDVSNSMAATGKLDAAKQALARLTATLGAKDEMLYLQFHRKVDKVVNFTSDRKCILSALANTAAKQDGTALYDAIAQALCAMRTARWHRQALVVITDGADQHSHRSLEDLVTIIQKAPVQVFIVGYLGKAEYELYRASKEKVTLVTSQEIDNPVKVFVRLAVESGAASFFPASPSKLDEAFNALARELRTQYTVAYYPASRAAAFRRIVVRVAQPGARVRTRRGFASDDPTSAAATVPCGQEKLRPYPYESQVESKNGRTIYRDDFRNEAGGWPSGDRYRYASGAYQLIAAKHAPPVIVGEATADSGQGVLVANGPWFADLRASISVKLNSSGGLRELPAAGGLVFRLNDNGYYALLISAPAPRLFKVVKKYHSEGDARDLIPWTPFPGIELTNRPQDRISIECRGLSMKVLLQDRVAASLEDASFPEGMVGMVLYGAGRATFRDLFVEELSSSPQVSSTFRCGSIDAQRTVMTLVASSTSDSRLENVSAVSEASRRVIAQQLPIASR